MPRLSNVSATIEQYPGATFALFALLHLAVWTALPALLYPNLPLDLIEALTYGREWQLGYDKLPPMPWWLVEATYGCSAATCSSMRSRRSRWSPPLPRCGRWRDRWSGR